jgi:hypothetical protein
MMRQETGLRIVLQPQGRSDYRLRVRPHDFSLAIWAKHLETLILGY